jgi:hypothetical protein
VTGRVELGNTLANFDQNLFGEEQKVAKSRNKKANFLLKLVLEQVCRFVVRVLMERMQSKMW